MANSVAAKEAVKVEVSRILPVKRSRIYTAWTQPEQLQQWFGPSHLQVVKVSADVRVGGEYCIEMVDPTASKDAPHPMVTGKYQVVIPDEMLCFTWNGPWDPDGETLVTVSLRDADSGTRIIIQHERFVSPETGGQHGHGWERALDNLAAFCTA